jgi:CRP-like cAMP-binding protein
MDGKLWYLKSCRLFEQLTPREAEYLERRAALRNFKRNSLIYAPTEPGESVLVLAQGRVKIKDITPDGKETILAFIDEGELFGELALLEGESRRDYAEALVDSAVVLIPRQDLLHLIEPRPDLALSIIKLIGLRRRRIENRLRNVLFLSSRDRMVRLLIELTESHGERAGNRCAIRLPLSHQDLASLVGLTRETVTHVLGQLQGDGLIRVERRRLTVLDCPRLAQEAGELPTVPQSQPDRQSPMSKAGGL